MATTRRVIERVPSEKGEWKPHPKSFPLAHLAQLVAWMPGWLPQALRHTSLDLAQAEGYSFEKTETLLELFDHNVRDAREAFAAASDDDFNVDWSLRNGDRILFTQSRLAVVRGTVNHLIHHRGQLTVYLRMFDVPVPSIYGPTADEPWGAGAER